MSSVSEESSASLGPGLRIGILFLSLNFSLDTIKLFSNDGFSSTFSE